MRLWLSTLTHSPSSPQHPPPLRAHPPWRGSAPAQPHALGDMLLHFFEMYGYRLNYNEVGVRVSRDGGFFRKRSRGWVVKDRPYLLSVESPIDPSVDVGANTYNIRSVRRAFGHSYCALAGKMARIARGGAGAPAGAEAAAASEAEADAAAMAGTEAAPSGARRLRLLSAVLDVEAEMAERFRMHREEREEEGSEDEAEVEAAELDGWVADWVEGEGTATTAAAREDAKAKARTKAKAKAKSKAKAEAKVGAKALARAQQAEPAASAGAAAGAAVRGGKKRARPLGNPDERGGDAPIKRRRNPNQPKAPRKLLAFGALPRGERKKKITKKTRDRRTAKAVNQAVLRRAAANAAANAAKLAGGAGTRRVEIVP